MTTEPTEKCIIVLNYNTLHFQPNSALSNSIKTDNTLLSSDQMNMQCWCHPVTHIQKEQMCVHRQTTAQHLMKSSTGTESTLCRSQQHMYSELYRTERTVSEHYYTLQNYTQLMTHKMLLYSI